jgi:triosephosphate isomerase
VTKPARKPARRRFVAGNWKMNLDRASALALCAVLHEQRGSRDGARVAVAPPFVYLADVARALEGSAIQVGAQDVCERVSGAFTGEVSAAMLKDVGARFAIVGHSERRHVYGERDELVREKLRRVLDAGLEGILCVGETLAERQAKETEEVVARQLTRALEGVAGVELARVTLAYEPVWAIGTGRAATPDQAQAAQWFIRKRIRELGGEATAEAVRIQYGGSVTAENARELFAQPDVDGALVGGASLDAEAFVQIVHAAC